MTPSDINSLCTYFITQFSYSMVKPMDHNINIIPWEQSEQCIKYESLFIPYISMYNQGIIFENGWSGNNLVMYG